MTPEQKAYYGTLSGVWSGSLNANHKMTDEQARIQELEANEATLRAEVAHFTQSGIVEIAVRNPSVAEYMVHWEQRAETAEAEVARLREALEGARSDIARLLNALDSAAETMREKCLAAAQQATEQHPGDPHRLIQAIYSVLMSEVMAEALSEE